MLIDSSPTELIHSWWNYSELVANKNCSLNYQHSMLY